MLYQGFKMLNHSATLYSVYFLQIDLLLSCFTTDVKPCDPGASQVPSSLELDTSRRLYRLGRDQTHEAPVRK